jgi:hypothetical protein
MRRGQRHEDFIEIAVAGLERLFLEPVFLKADAGIETSRGLVARDDGQLDHLDAAARGVDDRLDKPPPDAAPSRFVPHVHADEMPLVGHLDVLKNVERGDADELPAAESAENVQAAKPLRKPAHGLGAFRLERARKRIGREPQRFEPDVPIERCVVRSQPAHLDVRSIHDTTVARGGNVSAKQPFIADARHGTRMTSPTSEE